MDSVAVCVSEGRESKKLQLVSALIPWETSIETVSNIQYNGFHLYFSEGKHPNMNSQQQCGNGCNHQGPNQNHKPETVGLPETQVLPMPIPDLPVQYTKVSCSRQAGDPKLMAKKGKR